MLYANENASAVLENCHDPVEALFEFLMVGGQLVLTTCDQSQEYSFQCFSLNALKDFYMNTKYYYSKGEPAGDFCALSYIEVCRLRSNMYAV